ncbi:hypothetical protein HQ531_05070, partial [bacterium]|nr:hypothetical protein [bacterium]
MSVQPFSIFISYRFVEFSKLRTRLILKLNSLGLKCNIHDLGSDKSSRSAFPATPSIKSTEIVANHTSLLILLLGDTYSKGIIEKEYDTAIERGIPILPYYIGKYGEEENYYPYEKPKDIIEDDDTYIKLCKFKKKVRENGELCGNHLLDWSAVEGIPARSKSDYAKRVEEIAKEIFDNVSEVFQHALLKGFSSYIISRKHYGVPKLPNNYIHREKETVAIREMLLAELGQGNRVAGATMGIAAMGGTGKSVIATKLAKDEFILNHFNSGIFWVEVNQVPDVRNLLQLICTQIDIVVDESSSLELLNSKLEEYFYSKTILLVLDDVWDIRHLKQFHFINDSSKTLITTKFKRVLGDSVIYDLGQLSPQQALELLKKKVDTVTEENLDLVEKILKETGGLALAVDIVSSMMRGKITEYWESILKNLQGSKISSIHNRRENKLHDSLHIVIDLSVQTLTTEAKQGLLSLAIFPEGYHISIETLRPYLGVNVFEIVHEIVDACLLIGNEDGTNSLHDLVRDYLIETLDDNLRTYNKLFINQYYEYYNGKWESFPQNDDYFLNNYINIAVEEELTDKAKEITNKLLCTYKYLQKEWIIDSIKLLELNPHNVAKILLRNAVRYDVFLWILSLLEKTQVDVIAFAERYLENAEPKNSDFTIETIKVLGEDNPTVETFSEDYLKNVEPKDSKITVQAIRVLGKDNSTVKKFSKGYLKNVEAKNSDITL